MGIMQPYNKIVNPETNRKVNISSSLGKKILKKYLLVLKGGSPKLGPHDGHENAFLWTPPYSSELEEPALFERNDNLVNIDNSYKLFYPNPTGRVWNTSMGEDNLPVAGQAKISLLLDGKSREEA